jgi:phage portal protein BeeE
MMQGRHVIQAGLVCWAGSSKVVRPLYSKVVRPLYSPAEQAIRRWLLSAAGQYKVTVSSCQNSMQLSTMHVWA